MSKLRRTGRDDRGSEPPIASARRSPPSEPPRKGAAPDRRKLAGATPVVAPAPPPRDLSPTLPDSKRLGRRSQASMPAVVEPAPLRPASPRSRASMQWLTETPARDQMHPAHRSIPAPATEEPRPRAKRTERGLAPVTTKAVPEGGEPQRDRTQPEGEAGDSRGRRPPSSRRGDGSPLEQAILERQIEVVFQPVVDLKSGSIFAYEALARSKSPYFVDPTVLFEEALRAERCGELGRLLRGLAVEQCPDVPLFLNVHPSELNDRYLVRPDDPLYAHPHPVFLEITESVPISHYEFCHTVLREIRSRGVFLVVDDLGAGYSNLMYIVDLYPEVVKLDRKLVTGLHQRPRQQLLVRHIVELCSGLGARVVAEGIETLDELHAVRDQGVRYVQGFLLGRPSNPPPPIALARRDLG